MNLTKGAKPTLGQSKRTLRSEEGGGEAAYDLSSRDDGFQADGGMCFWFWVVDVEQLVARAIFVVAGGGVSCAVPPQAAQAQATLESQLGVQPTACDVVSQ